VKLDRNKNLVEEVINAITDMHLAYNINLLNLDVNIVCDYQKAKELAWSQDLDEVENVWEDIKSLESGDIIGKLYEDDLNSMERPIREMIQSSEIYPSDFVSKYIEIFEEISGDLYICALNRLINGNVDNFYERIFDIYKLGAWPCGWQGNYPEGKMIVYVPEKIQ